MPCGFLKNVYACSYLWQQRPMAYPISCVPIALSKTAQMLFGKAKRPVFQLPLQLLLAL